MSSVVAETSSHVASQSARQKSGQGSQSQGSQSAGKDGFSGLVDSNLSAADGSEQAPQADRSRAAARDTSTEAQAKPQTGVRRQSQAQAESARQASNEGAANQRRAPQRRTRLKSLPKRRNRR